MKTLAFAGIMLSLCFGVAFLTISPTLPIIKPSVVLVRSEVAMPELPEAGKIRFTGAGFMVNGHLLTASHVVSVPERFVLLKTSIMTFDGKTEDVHLIRADDDTDLAEITHTLPIPSLPLYRGRTFNDMKIIGVGHPGNLMFIENHGYISGHCFSKDCWFGDIATIDGNNGVSGGPITTESGLVVGMYHGFQSGTRYFSIGTLKQLTDFLGL